MSIEKITTDFAGQIGVEPRVIRIKTTNTQAEILAPNFLQGAISMGYSFYPTDAALVSVTDNVTDLYRISITPSEITLVPSVNQISGTHVTTWSGVWALAQTGDISYTITGITVRLDIPRVIADGDSSEAVITIGTNLPAFLRPLGSHPIRVIYPVQTDGGSNQASGLLLVQPSNGQITIAASVSNAVFTGVTTALGFQRASVSYDIV